MEKVKLTPKQAESLEYLKRNFRFKEIVILHVQKYGCDWAGKGEGINGLDVDTLIKALYIGYEIEEPFKVGDWVVWLGDICEIIRFQCDTPMKDDGRCYLTIKRLSDGEIIYNVDRENLRLATEEEITAETERQKWKAIGRKVNEYRKGDFVKVKGEEFYGVIERPLGNDHYQVRDLHYSRSPYIDADILELICPVEHRFDLKGDDDESARD
jgi:hypothetical protein